MAIRIVTDSTADLNAELIEKYNIKIAPLTVHFKDASYKDSVDISPKEFYEKLKTCDEIPKTSLVNTVEFEEIFNEVLNDGDDIIGIFIASDLSGTFNSAGIAKGAIGSDKIHLIDSKTSCCGLGALVVYASKLIEQGKSLNEIIEAVENIKKDVRIYCMPGSLEYLKKGGRLSGTKAFIGTMLDIKPIVELSNGIIEAIEKTRGTQKGIAYMIDRVGEHIKQDSEIFVFSAENGEAADRMIERLKNEFGAKIVHICDMGPTIGVHLGPGTVGIAMII